MDKVAEINVDEFARNPKTPFSVIPAEAGIQEYQELLDPGACPGPDPGFAGVTAWGLFAKASMLKHLASGVFH